ncbi:hypothetical protein LR48_Vigan115s001700 [Vigna angularis]|uniref:Uncharacterized protein n=1 Tax=Phaseolus angularis TaxID=3914 RepID=A0A0L9T4P3_PHAAN|nr:hypothetical protein LR48_Vigan115s001700 [Vigna angularis]
MIRLWNHRASRRSALGRGDLIVESPSNAFDSLFVEMIRLWNHRASCRFALGRGDSTMESPSGAFDPPSPSTFVQSFKKRSEEGEKGNQKRHQKVQKEEPQLPLNGSLPLSGTQEVTGDPLRGKMAAEGKNRARALTAELYFTAERHTYGLGPNFSVIYE